MKDSNEAKSVVNDSFIKILEKLDTLKDPKVFKSWASRIVRNTAIDHIRKNNNYKSYVRLDDYDENAAELAPTAIDSLNGEDLLLMIQKLDESERLVFVMFFVEEFSHKEIAKKLEITSEMSRWLLYKARKNFKKIYARNNSSSIALKI